MLRTKKPGLSLPPLSAFRMAAAPALTTVAGPARIPGGPISGPSQINPLPSYAGPQDGGPSAATHTGPTVGDPADAIAAGGGGGGGGAPTPDDGGGGGGGGGCGGCAGISWWWLLVA